MIKVNGEARVLTAESKPYDFNGNKGTSHKVRLAVEGEIYVVSSNEAQVTALKSLVGRDVNVVLCFESKRERLSLTLENFSIID